MTSCTWMLIIFMGKPVMLPVCQAPGAETEPIPPAAQGTPYFPPQEPLGPVRRSHKKNLEL